MADRIRQIRDKYRDGRVAQEVGHHKGPGGTGPREAPNAPGAAASTLLGHSSSYSAISKGGGYYGAPGPLPDLTQEMLRVEADIQMINSQIKNGPGQGLLEAVPAGADHRRKRDSTMDKIDALLQPSSRPE